MEAFLRGLWADPVVVRHYHNVETLSGNKTLANSDVFIQNLDPNGSSRDVNLPAEADSVDLCFLIMNVATDDAETLVLKDDTPTTLGTLYALEAAFVSCDGTTWTVRFMRNTEGAAVNTSLFNHNVESLSGDKTLAASDAFTQNLDPNGSSRDVNLPAEASSDKLNFLVTNTADADGELLTVKDDTPTTLGVLHRQESALVSCDGTTWTIRFLTTGRQNFIVNTETLSGDKTLLWYSPTIQDLDPGGSSRDVNLPAEALSKNVAFIVTNKADGSGEHLVVKDDTPTTLGTLYQDQSAILSCDGTSWTFRPLLDPSPNISTYSSDQTLTEKECINGICYVTGAAVIKSPPVFPQFSLRLITIGDVAVSLDPDDNDKLIVDGDSTYTDGEKATNASTSGDEIIATYYSADGPYCTSNGWTNGG